MIRIITIRYLAKVQYFIDKKGVLGELNLVLITLSVAIFYPNKPW
jgi:hypothetical protein